jgi:hypothetical protein
MIHTFSVRVYLAGERCDSVTRFELPGSEIQICLQTG